MNTPAMFLTDLRQPPSMYCTACQRSGHEAENCVASQCRRCGYYGHTDEKLCASRQILLKFIGTYKPYGETECMWCIESKKKFTVCVLQPFAQEFSYMCDGCLRHTKENDVLIVPLTVTRAQYESAQSEAPSRADTPSRADKPSRAETSSAGRLADTPKSNFKHPSRGLYTPKW